MPEVFNSSTYKKKDTVKKKKSSHSDHSDQSAQKERSSHRSVDEYSEILAAEPKSSRVFTSYLPKPKHTHFESQGSAEHVVLLLRQHPITQLRWIVMALFFAFVPFGFSFFPMYDILPARYQVGLLMMWYLALFGFSLQSFLKWFYNVYILTDERVIDVDFMSLAQKNITSAKIDHIEDVTSESIGFSSTFFDYGTILIQTAAAAQELTFEAVPKPAKVTAIINDLLLEEEREKIEGRTH